MKIADKILEVAKTQIGVKEYPPNSNNVKYNTAYYGRAVSGNAYPWCAVFVWWVFRTAGVSNLYFGGDKTASCTTLMRYYKAMGKLVTDYKPGDIVFYQFDKDSYADHVGIIENVEGSYITAIEGNTSENGSQSNGGAVLRKRRNKKLVMAAARPYYEDESEDEDMFTYEQFEKYMNRYMKELAKKEPQEWSKEVREWAEANGIIVGDENGDKMYESPITREQAIAILYRGLKLFADAIDKATK